MGACRTGGLAPAPRAAGETPAPRAAGETDGRGKGGVGRNRRSRAGAARCRREVVEESGRAASLLDVAHDGDPTPRRRRRRERERERERESK